MTSRRSPCHSMAATCSGCAAGHPYTQNQCDTQGPKTRRPLSASAAATATSTRNPIQDEPFPVKPAGGRLLAASDTWSTSWSSRLASVSCARRTKTLTGEAGSPKGCSQAPGESLDESRTTSIPSWASLPRMRYAITWLAATVRRAQSPPPWPPGSPRIRRRRPVGEASVMGPGQDRGHTTD